MSTTLGLTEQQEEQEPIRIAHGINAITVGDLIWFFFKAIFALIIATLPYGFAVLIIALMVSK